MTGWESDYSFKSWPRSPVKNAAQQTMVKEVRNNRIKRQPCEKCGLVNAHAHHDDYSKPLAVRWLCHWHHQEQHGVKLRSLYRKDRLDKQAQDNP